MGQPEVVEAVIERRSGQGDPQPTHVGEAGEADLAGFVGLAEDDLLLLTVDGLPGGDPALKLRRIPAPSSGRRPICPRNRNRPHAGGGLQHRNDLALKHTGQTVPLRVAAAPT